MHPYKAWDKTFHEIIQFVSYALLIVSYYIFIVRFLIFFQQQKQMLLWENLISREICK